MKFTKKFFRVEAMFKKLVGFAIGYEDKEIIIVLPFCVIYITLYV